MYQWRRNFHVGSHSQTCELARRKDFRISLNIHHAKKIERKTFFRLLDHFDEENSIEKMKTLTKIDERLLCEIESIDILLGLLALKEEYVSNLLLFRLVCKKWSEIVLSFPHLELEMKDLFID